MQAGTRGEFWLVFVIAGGRAKQHLSVGSVPGDK